MDSFISPIIRAAAAFVQRQPDASVFHADAVFAVIQNCYTVARLRQVSVFMVGNLEFRLFPGRVAVGRALDITELHFISRKTALNRSVKRSL